MTTHLLFGALPYVALALLGGRLVARYLSASARGEDVRADAAEAWALFGGGKIGRGGLLALALLHAAGGVFPRSILLWNGVPLRLYVLEATGFLFGLVALGWWAGVMRRHLRRSSASAAREVADGVLLSLLFVEIASGLLTATLYRWGSSWGAATLAPYASSLLGGTPLVTFVAQMPHLVQLHVVSAFALMSVLPFTRAASFAVLAARWTVGLAAAPLSAAAVAARGWIDRVDPVSLIWAEEGALTENPPTEAPAMKGPAMEAVPHSSRAGHAAGSPESTRAA